MSIYARFVLDHVLVLVMTVLMIVLADYNEL